MYSNNSLPQQKLSVRTLPGKMEFWLKTKSQLNAGPGYRDSSTKYQATSKYQLAPFIRVY